MIPRISLSCLSLIFPLFLFAEDTESFVEQTDTKEMVVWKDLTIPAEKELQNLVVMQGTVDLFGKVQNLVLINGKVILEKGSRVEGKLHVLGGEVQQLEGAFVFEEKPGLKQRFGSLRNKIESFWDRFSERLSEWMPSFF